MVFDDKDLRPVRGMRDLTPEEYYPMLQVFDKLARIAESFGYLRIETPALEYYEILKAKAGEDVINEIYYFKDKAGREVGLRFDMTVPVARVVSYRVDVPKPIRWYYITKVWRYDEPQHGRYREFHQFGIEFLGTSSVRADAEVLAVGVESLRAIDIGDFRIRINDRRVIDQLLSKIGVTNEVKPSVLRIMDKRGKVTEDELLRMLRDLGLNNDASQEILRLANTSETLDKAIDSFRELGVGEEFIKYHSELIEYLDMYGVRNYMDLDMGIVRGLDYYTGIVFEMYVPDYKLSVGGGGRYDNLIEIYSGKLMPASGFAMGIERLLEVLEQRGTLKRGTPQIDYYIYVVSNEVSHLSLGYKLMRSLRANGSKVVIDTGEKSLRSALEYASKINVKYFVIVGPREISQGVVKVRDMSNWSERDIPLSEFGLNT
ncbi:histidine--tRNA ligase [Vulcanisaeta souniana]|uniref:Histidine--tRNA ligase n=1 Tax=Vulcanisaeta souniana JCM 11219 TaxID=1293586 RepID=A0A830EG21_9CREN|nr:histidine--tRNA ligase [Vulcanisaeta souniana]BDR91455.1 histidine--tRNA ligase [Vulcanisaeta souniana JCM 11219]GGI73308.1 histidine--tRNA ligase [Vulcanisaeta souniana JCM 11219]